MAREVVVSPPMKREADGALVSDHRYFGRVSIRQHVEQGDDATCREVDLRSGAPDSYTTAPRAMFTSFRCGNSRSPTELGSALSRWFCWGGSY